MINKGSKEPFKFFFINVIIIENQCFLSDSKNHFRATPKINPKPQQIKNIDSKPSNSIESKDADVTLIIYKTKALKATNDITKESIIINSLNSF